MNYLDYIIIGLLLFYALWGLSKGFLKLIADLAGYILAFLAAKFLSPFLVEYLYKTPFPASIQENIYNTFSRISPEITPSVETITIPNNLSSLIESEPGLRSVFNTFPNLRETIDQNLSVLSGQPFMATITSYLVTIISILAIFLVVKILVSVVASIIFSRQDYFPLAFVNRVLGLVVGLATAILIVAFTLQIIEFYALASSPIFADTIARSRYGHHFTSLPLLEWLHQFTPY